jgi:deferrochelatase/peroxidase EfeB
MLRRLLPHVAPADEWWVPSLPGWLGIAFTFEGLKALGVPQASLDSFPVEFRQGMAARAAILHDFGANAPDKWEHPFGTPDVHVALALYAKDDESLQKVLELARKAHHDLPQISVVYRMQFGELPEGRNPFGFKDGLHNPHVEGSGSAYAGDEAPTKAGEFILGYPDELGETAKVPIPEELRHNGTFVAFRKFHMDVAAFRRYLRTQASSPEEEELRRLTALQENEAACYDSQRGGSTKTRLCLISATRSGSNHSVQGVGMLRPRTLGLPPKSVDDSPIGGMTSLLLGHDNMATNRNLRN